MANRPKPPKPAAKDKPSPAHPKPAPKPIGKAIGTKQPKKRG